MPEPFDFDLQSIQEARNLVIAAREAQRAFLSASQEDVDRVCAAMAEAAYAEAASLGRIAQEETGFGVVEHKAVKNRFASRGVWESIKDIRTVGVLCHDEVKKIMEVAWPLGVIAGLVPSTNPTSTVIYKTLIAVKARNAIVFSPHPSARRCTAAAAQVMATAAEAAGAPRGLVSCLTHLTLAGTQELMKHPITALILATGGTPMVRAAHSVGKPAIGVGPGNVPVWVDRSADIDSAARCIVNSKAFDCSVICSTEQTVIADAPIADSLRKAMEKNGAYWLTDEQKLALQKVLFTTDGAMNAKGVGKTPQALARMAGITVPGWARVLVAPLQACGPEEPLSREKLTTVLGFMVEDGWHAGCERSIQFLRFGGDGHSLSIHCQDPQVILAFGLEKPAFRIVVNTWSSLGAVGATTGLMPAFTLAPGGIGGTSVGDNVTVTHLFNKKRIAYGITEPPPEAYLLAPDVIPEKSTTLSNGNGNMHLDEPALQEIIRRVMAQFLEGA